MKIKFEDELSEVLAKTVSEDYKIAYNAISEFCLSVEPVLSKYIEENSYAYKIFSNELLYMGPNPPEIPLDSYFGIGETAKIWSSNFPGGLAYNEISGESVFRFRPTNLFTAIAWNKNYYEKESKFLFPFVAQFIQRLAEETITKIDYAAFAVLSEICEDSKNKSLQALSIESLGDFIKNNKANVVLISKESQKKILKENGEEWPEFKGVNFLFADNLLFEAFKQKKGIIVGIDTKNESLFRAVETKGNGNSVSFEYDDQHRSESGKTGYISEWSGGFCVSDDKKISFLVS